MGSRPGLWHSAWLAHYLASPTLVCFCPAADDFILGIKKNTMRKFTEKQTGRFHPGRQIQAPVVDEQ